MAENARGLGASSWPQHTADALSVVTFSIPWPAAQTSSGVSPEQREGGCVRSTPEFPPLGRGHICGGCFRSRSREPHCSLAPGGSAKGGLCG